MDYTKLKLKELLTIIRDNNKTQEVQKELNINNLKYAKKKDIIDYLNKCSNITTDINHYDYDNDNIDYESDLEAHNLPMPDSISAPDIPKEKQEIDEVIILNLDNIKNKKKQKKIDMPISEVDLQLKQDREDAIDLINVYINTWPWLKNEPVNLDDPIRALRIIKQKVTIKNSKESMTEIFYMSCDTVEHISTTTPQIHKYCKLDGFAANIRAHKALKNVLDELIIKYAPSIVGEDGCSCPEMTLAIIMLTCAWGTHCTNEKILINNKDTSKFKYDKSL